MFSIFKRWRRRKILAADFPADWLDILTRNVWQFQFLTPSQQQTVKNCIQVMTAEKNWEGVDGFPMTPEIQITIAGTASLLVLGLDSPYYFDRITSIIVHPRTIRSRLLQHGYVVDPDDEFFAGLAWQGGPLVFSWQSVIEGTRQSGSGRNVVIHEFAHHIDGLDGEMGGMPYIESDALRKRWSRIFDRDYGLVVADIRARRPPLIDPYAGTNKAEFFAVTSEIFFDSPRFLQQQLPDVFGCLKDFYNVDPLTFEMHNQ